MLASQPCLGIFHDFCLIGLLDGWANATGATGDDYEAQIIATYGEGARETARQAREGSLSLPAIANRMPMTEWLAAKCAGAMAHAEFYLPRLRRACAGPVAVAPLAYALEHPSPASERRDGRLILATFGDIVANKCAAEIIAAIASAPSLRERLEYHLIGAIAADERARLQDLADAAGFTGLRIHGRVEEEAFLRHLAGADIVSCVRKPVIEGASGSAIEAMLASKPVLVANAGFYAELPDDLVFKLPAQISPKTLSRQIEWLADNADQRAAVGARAAAWARKHFSPSGYAAALDNLARETADRFPALKVDPSFAVPRPSARASQPGSKPRRARKVLVLNTAVPFVRGGAEALADQLVAHLNAIKGVESELIKIPFQWVPFDRVIEEILIARSLRLENVDQVIALKFPAYLVPFENKTLWLLHQFRQAYDLGEAGQGLGDGARDQALRAAIRAADETAFGAARQLYCNSPVTQARLAHYNGFAAEVLYPPMNDEALFTGGRSAGYIFAGGRVGPAKRQHLLIEALARVRGSARLIIAGPPDSEDYADSLRALVERHELASRVELRLGFHPRERIAAWVNEALACALLPFDEDSLSYVAMEAFTAGKPVLTASDCGGVLGLVTAETGIVAEPDAASLAEGLARLAADPAATEALGKAARAAWLDLGISWEQTIEKLLV
jgi:glycosyltransferase involved in cell wall biosynthesis